MKSLGKKWRDWKADLKARYFNPIEVSVCFSNPPDRVLQTQWESLVLYLNSEEGKKRSVVNRRNRLKQKFPHTTGTKTFAQVRDEEQQKRPDGSEPTRAEIFIITHIQTEDKETSEAISKIKSIMSEPPEEDSPVDNTEGDHLSQAIGKDQHGHVRTYGLGPRQSDIWGSTSANMEERVTTSEIFTNDRTKELTMKLEVMEKNYAMLEKNYAVMEAKFDKCSNLLERVLSTLCPGQTSLVEDDIAIAPNQASTKPYATAKSFKSHGSDSSSSHVPKSSKRRKTKKA